MQISSLKDDLEKEHQRWQAAQANYERQVCSSALFAFLAISKHAVAYYLDLILGP